MEKTFTQAIAPYSSNCLFISFINRTIFGLINIAQAGNCKKKNVDFLGFSTSGPAQP